MKPISFIVCILNVIVKSPVLLSWCYMLTVCLSLRNYQSGDLPDRIQRMIQAHLSFQNNAYFVNTKSTKKVQEVWDALIELFDNPKVEVFKNIQSKCENDSERKNLKRKVEKKTDMFRFLNVGKELLIYPTSLKVDDLVVPYYETKKTVEKLQKLVDVEKSIKNTALFLRKEITDTSYEMQWPPRADDLKFERFIIPTHLDSFLTVLLSSNEVITDRVARLKLSFSQDLIYAVHNGKLLTPKSILFPCHIKELTNNCELITTANRLGHGVSYSKLQEILSEVAYEKI